MFKNLNPSALGISGHQSEIIGGPHLRLWGDGPQRRGFCHSGETPRHGIRPAADGQREIRLGTFALPVDWEADDETFQKELKKLPEYAQAAAAVDCTRCVATLVPGSDTRPYHENFDFHRRRFHEICKALEPAGVRLGVGFAPASTCARTLPSSSSTTWTP